MDSQKSRSFLHKQIPDVPGLSRLPLPRKKFAGRYVLALHDNHDAGLVLRYSFTGAQRPGAQNKQGDSGAQMAG
jgi:hypothetical protein